MPGPTSPRVIFLGYSRKKNKWATNDSRASGVIIINTGYPLSISFTLRFALVVGRSWAGLGGLAGVWRGAKVHFLHEEELLEELNGAVKEKLAGANQSRTFYSQVSKDVLTHGFSRIGGVRRKVRGVE